MPVLVKVEVICEGAGCQAFTAVPLVLSNSSGEPNLKFTAPPGWAVIDMGALRTIVRCPDCIVREQQTLVLEPSG